MTQKITSIKLQKKNPNRVNIYLDDEYAFGISKIVARGLRINEELTTEKIEQLLVKDSQEIAYQKALHFLSYRPRSEEEIRKNLRKHNISDEVIQTVIERLQRSKLVDDNEFAKSWVNNRKAFHPRSQRVLRMELRQKGISEHIIEQSIKEVNDEEMAYRLAQKQSRKYLKLDWFVFRKKLSAYLARRGFNYGIISPIVKQIYEDLVINAHENL